MKKIVLLFAMIYITLSVKAQIIVTSDSLNYREYEDRYLFNHCSREGINMDILFWHTGFSGNVPYGFYMVNSGIHVEAAFSITQSNIQADYAQPYNVNAPITISGVSGFVWHYVPEQYIDSCRWYFEIWDSTLTTILRSVDITDTATPHTYYGYYIDNFSNQAHSGNLYYKYTEKFFDEPLTITGKFYVVYHTPDSVSLPIGTYDMSTGIAETNMCAPGIELYPLKRGGMTGEVNWHYFKFNGRQETDTVTALYLFPILADRDTVVSNLEERNIVETVRVFPNPTDNEVNINSGYKIERIFLYDESGKLLEEKEVKAYNYKIDLQRYSQGSYLLKVQTTKNTTTHKLIRY